MENKVSIILSSDVWMHIAKVLLVAEDLTREQTPALASQLHVIANNILNTVDVNNVFYDRPRRVR